MWEEHNAWQNSKRLCPEPPSTYYYDRVFGCFTWDRHGVRSLDEVGENNICFETDYPHTDTTWPNSKDLLREDARGPRRRAEVQDPPRQRDPHARARPRRVDFSLTDSERDLVGLCREFAQKEIAHRAPLAWDEGRCPTDLLREMGALGLLGMLIPEEWGGIGMSTIGFVAAMEQLGLADQSVAAAWQAHVTIGSLPLYLFGTDEQRERWLRPLAEGRALGAFGLTEPDAGSDARGSVPGRNGATAGG